MQKHQGNRWSSHQQRFFVWLGTILGLFIVSSCGSVSARTSTVAPSLTAHPSVGAAAVIVYTIRLANEGGWPDAIIARRASDGSPLWRFPIKGTLGFSNFSDPVVVDHGLVYINTTVPNADYTRTDNPGNTDFLYAVGASDGTQRWRYQADTEIDSVTVADGTVYLISSFSASLFSTSLIALRARDGHLLWKHTIGGATGIEITGVAISGGVVYISTGEGLLKLPVTGSLYALHASDGSLLWQSQVGKHYFFPLHLVNGIIYVGASDDYWPFYDFSPQPFSDSLYAVRASDGRQLWHSKIWSSQLAHLSYQESQGVVYMTTVAPGSSSTSTVTALQAKDGTSLWQRLVPDLMMKVTATAGVVYVYADKGHLQALRASNGAVLWNAQVQPQNGMYPSSLQVLADEQRAFLVSTFPSGLNSSLGIKPVTLEVRKVADGTVVWQYPYQGAKYTTLILKNGMVYVGISSNELEASGGSVCAIQASAGTRLWCIQTDTRVQHLMIGA